MQQLPNTENALVLRTDFTDDAAWEEICANIQAPVGEFQAYVNFLDDSQYDGVTTEQLPTLGALELNYYFMFIVDKLAISHPENPILVVNLSMLPIQSFRAIPSTMWGIENNLSTANMDFEEFANTVNYNGIFAGFYII